LIDHCRRSVAEADFLPGESKHSRSGSDTIPALI
jgi:hypothetical protein